MASLLLCASVAGQDEARDPVDAAAADLDARRKQHQERVLRVATKEVSRGWKLKKASGYLLIASEESSNSASIKHLDSVAKAVRKWLDKGVGATWKPRPGQLILRVCADRDQVREMLGGLPGPYSWERFEVVCQATGGGGRRGAFSDLGRGFVHHYLDAHVPGLWRVMPAWVANGLDSQARTALITKRVGFVFQIPTGSWRRAAELVKSKERMIPLRDIVAMGSRVPKTGTRRNGSDARILGDCLVRYLTIGPGEKNKAKGALSRYVGSLARELRRRQAARWADVLARVEKPAERVEAWKEFERECRRQRISGMVRDELQELAVADAFGEWTDKDWALVQRSFTAWVRKGMSVK